MPLPNAEKRSNRIYPIIKGKTLEEIASGENPTIDNIGKPIDVMLLNEDELRRLVLIKFAITACKADWDGFLTQGDIMDEGLLGRLVIAGALVDLIAKTRAYFQEDEY